MKMKRAIGNSMLYLIMTGDKLIYDEDIVSFGKGDLFIYVNRQGKEVCHRYLGKFGKTCIFLGDNCTNLEFIQKDAIIGKLHWIINRTGKIYNINQQSKDKLQYTNFLLYFVFIKKLYFKYGWNFLEKKYYRYLWKRNRAQIRLLESCKMDIQT
mgnify:FL=1